MDSSTLINNLVETYKTLNTTYRKATPTDALTSIITRMRNDEVQFSQALKDRITGIGTAGGPGREYVDGLDTTLAQLISQFGTARATTLNLLKGIHEDRVWDQPLDDGSTIRAHVQDLVTSDKNQLARLSAAVNS
ncbi:MAG: hypothetical protein KC435_11105 [Thermomicrobiales bacterium]|nr:hypothetical protein [Thermomicrobiales bacterium]